MPGVGCCSSNYHMPACCLHKATKHSEVSSPHTSIARMIPWSSIIYAFPPFCTTRSSNDGLLPCAKSWSQVC